MESKNIQQKFLSYIQGLIAPKNLVDELPNILNTSKSGAYRRINCKTPLTIEDIEKIMAHYDTISFDRFIRPNCAPFILPIVNNAPQNTHDYLDLIESDLKQAVQFPDVTISYAAQEVLFFHYLLVPELAMFKLYMWSRTIWYFDDTKHKTFDLKKYQENKKLSDQIERITHLYSAIRSEEVWSGNMLEVTFNQIRHCQRAGHFQNDSEVNYLISLLRQFCQKMQNLATLGEKKTGHNGSETSSKLAVWYNELIQNNTFVLARLSDDQQIIFSTFDSPNFMHSFDQRIYQQGQVFFNKLKKYARPIDGENNERVRRLFFDRLNQRIDFFEQELSENEYLLSN